MKRKFPSGLFITGTDTGIGKTVVSAMLVRGLKADYWKPVQSGLENGLSDTDRVRQWTGLPDNHFHPECYKLSEPLSPHAAARIDGVEIDLNAFELPAIAGDKRLIVEGAGGIMVPLNKTSMMLTLMKYLRLPVVLVTRTTLGTINHTLLSIEQLRHYDIPLTGVIMNGPENMSNREAIETYGKVEVLGRIDPMPEISAESLDEAFRKLFSQ